MKQDDPAKEIKVINTPYGAMHRVSDVETLIASAVEECAKLAEQYLDAAFCKGSFYGRQVAAAIRSRASQPAVKEPCFRVRDYEEVLADHRRLVRELDVAMNGEDGAAKQASLVDLIGPAEDTRKALASLKAGGEGWIPCAEQKPSCYGKEGFDIKLRDGSVLKNAILQSDDDWWWNGTAETFVSETCIVAWRPAKHAEGPAAKEGK